MKTAVVCRQIQSADLLADYLSLKTEVKTLVLNRFLIWALKFSFSIE